MGNKGVDVDVVVVVVAGAEEEEERRAKRSKGKVQKCFEGKKKKKMRENVANLRL